MAINFTYNHTAGLQNITTLEGLTTWTNRVTNDIAGMSFIFTLYAIVFLSLYRYGLREAIIGSAFLTLMVSILLMAINFVHTNVVVMITIILALSIMWAMRKQD